MSAQAPAKNWKAPAYAAVAKYYAIEAERESFEGRLREAREEAEKLGVTFRYGSPDVSASEALLCPCGNVVALDYESRRAVRGPDGVLHCEPCRAKTTQAQQEDDANEKGLPKPVSPPPAEDIPF